ncbi:MAG: hypothetical protein ACOYN4_09840 [Bacteroidales bacterium]
MKELRISSLPLQQLALHAFEALSINHKISLPFVHDIEHKKIIQAEIKQADDMIDHITSVIKENKSESSNPKS